MRIRELPSSISAVSVSGWHFVEVELDIPGFGLRASFFPFSSGSHGVRQHPQGVINQRFQIGAVGIDVG
ncbi:hypothetical protein GCM10007418_30710 [Halopseudomonas salina]|uniref:Uncharacterized protein n=1 Tax=Halopseudomonas salina TaxID=1323744 RepID=A0ABQ1Q285_9GAMM|nr:hypothetical protein GCM10007418_30710 [Halopseudomonas salina]